VGAPEISTLLEIEQDCWKVGISLLSSARDCEPVLLCAVQLLAWIYSKCNRPSVWSDGVLPAMCQCWCPEMGRTVKNQSLQD